MVKELAGTPLETGLCLNFKDRHYTVGREIERERNGENNNERNVQAETHSKINKKEGEGGEETHTVRKERRK